MTDARKFASLLLCGTLAGVGCTQTSTFRGQSPATPAAEPAASEVTQASFGAYSGGACPTGTCQSKVFGAKTFGLLHGGAGYAGGFGPGGYGCKPGAGDLFQKKHMNVYSYTQPAPLAYPEGTGGQGTPMAQVRYPYYPVKGPDDFFYDADGKF
ncbi:MAG: hypothetical protein AAGJ97_15860 [Planctomycetota bacterium]